jgi:hypothetical protein
MHTAQCQTGEVPYKDCPDDRNQQLLKARGNTPTLSRQIIEMGYIQPGRLAVNKMYIILWLSDGDEGREAHNSIVSESDLQNELNEIANKTGALGNHHITCYELGKELDLELVTSVHIKQQK